MNLTSSGRNSLRFRLLKNWFFAKLFSLQPKTAKLVEIDFFRNFNSSWEFNPSLATETYSPGGHFEPQLVANSEKVLEISFFPPETALIWCNWFLHPEQLSHCTFFICSLSQNLGQFAKSSKLLEPLPETPLGTLITIAAPQRRTLASSTLEKGDAKKITLLV